MHTPEPTPNTYDTTNLRVQIIAPNDDKLLPPRVPAQYHMVHIQPDQEKIHTPQSQQKKLIPDEYNTSNLVTYVYSKINTVFSN